MNKSEEIREQHNWTGCPCVYLETPCKDRCSCIFLYSSEGCLNCCTYGSKEQKTKQANYLSELRLLQNRTRTI